MRPMDMFDGIIEWLKTILLFISTVIAAVYTNVQDALSAIFIVFILNIVIGIAANVGSKTERFKIKKAFSALTQGIVYGLFVMIIYGVEQLLGDPEVGKEAVKWVSYVVIYYYSINILKNSIKIFPNAEALKLIYEVLTTQMFRRLKGYFSKTTANEEENEDR